MAKKKTPVAKAATNGKAITNGHVNQPVVQQTRFMPPRESSSVNAWNGLIENAYQYQRRILGQMFLDKRRDVGEECGYPPTEELTATDYKNLIDREPLAARVNDIYPRECWQVMPDVYESEDMEEVTPFEEALVQLNKDLLGPGFYEGEDAKPLWGYMERADKLSGIGWYGGILIGIDDGKELSEPAEFYKDGLPTPKHKILYIKPLDQTICEIATLEADETSPRYGQPLLYNVTYTTSSQHNSSRTLVRPTEKTATKQVHWTRIQHLAEDRLCSDVEAQPRLQVQYNRLYSLYMLYSGSAEMYWKGALPGLVFTQSEGAQQLDATEISAAKDKMEEYNNSLERGLIARNGQFSMLSPTVVDPASHINSQIEALCIYIGVPKRIFMGSERGELSSSQDERDWLKKVQKRQNTYLTTYMIVPFIDRLILMGVLPKPKQYCVKWPDMASMTALEKATLAASRTDAMAKYIAGGVEALMVPHDFLVREMGYDPNEATEILENAIEELEAKQAEQEEQAAQQLELAEAMAAMEPEEDDVGTGGEEDATEEKVPFASNAFCPTGPGGGIKPTCGGSKGGGGGKLSGADRQKTLDKVIDLTQKRNNTSDPTKRKKLDAQIAKQKSILKGGSPPSKPTDPKPKVAKSKTTVEKPTDTPEVAAQKPAVAKKSKPAPEEKAVDTKVDKSPSDNIVVGTHVKKVSGDKAEAETYISELNSIDKSFDGKLSPILEKYPLSEVKVGKTPTMGDSGGLYNKGTQNLTIRPTSKTGDPGLYEPGSSFSVTYGQSKGDSVVDKQKAAFTHELGHHIAFSAIKDKPDGSKSIYKDKIIDSFVSEKKMVSKYAATQPHEYFAESFSAYHHDKKSLSPTARKMVEDVVGSIGG